MSGKKDFFTRDKANEGVKLPLKTPDGKATDHWLQVRSIYSDEFKRKERSLRQDNPAIGAAAKAIKDDKEREKFLAEKWEESELALIATLVAGWSFDEPCTPEAVVEFLREAPQIARAVNDVSTSRALFFGSGPKPLKDSQE